MKKVSEAELAKLGNKKGVKVRRKMGAQPKAHVEDKVLPTNEVVEPETPVAQPQPHAAMAASMEAHAEDMRRMQQRFDAISAEFTKQIAELKDDRLDEATFDMVRGDDRLLKKVFLRRGIHDD